MRLGSLSLAVLLTVVAGCQRTARLDWDAPPPAAELSPIYVGTVCK